MTEPTHNMQTMPRPDSIATVVERVFDDAGVASIELRASLILALVRREEEIADLLRLAGAQFNLFPEIIAEMFAQVGLGRPITTEQREMIHANFHTLMNRLAAEFGQS